MLSKRETLLSHHPIEHLGKFTISRTVSVSNLGYIFRIIGKLFLMWLLIDIRECVIFLRLHSCAYCPFFLCTGFPGLTTFTSTDGIRSPLWLRVYIRLPWALHDVSWALAIFSQIYLSSPKVFVPKNWFQIEKFVNSKHLKKIVSVIKKERKNAIIYD